VADFSFMYFSSPPVSWLVDRSLVKSQPEDGGHKLLLSASQCVVIGSML